MKKCILDLDGFCSGCGACSIVCPTNAISIELNTKGFFEASIDKQNCILCGKCTSVCVKNINDYDTVGVKTGQLFASRSKNNVTLMSSSSGGIVSEIYKAAIKKGYKIVGTVYNYDVNRAEMICSDDSDFISLLSGSKYIQSFTVKAFEKAILYAKENKENNVIIVGTPCQIYGINKVLKLLNIRDQFILIDFFCHGVPSYLVWESYLAKIKKKTKSAKISSIKFRDKKMGWHNYWMEIVGDKKTYSQLGSLDLFYEAFFGNQLINDACFSCNLRRDYTSADIRVGDFWGNSFRNNNTGVSSVITISDNGKSFLEEIHSIEIIGEYNIKDYLTTINKNNYQKSNYREEAFSILQKTGNLEKAIRIYQSRKEKAKSRIKGTLALLPTSIKVFLRNKGFI